MVATTAGSLNSLYPALIIALSNSAPCFKNLTVMASTRLIQLFSSFSNPLFLLADEGHPRLLFFMSVYPFWFLPDRMSSSYFEGLRCSTQSSSTTSPKTPTSYMVSSRRTKRLKTLALSLSLEVFVRSAGCSWRRRSKLERLTGTRRAEPPLMMKNRRTRRNRDY